MKKLLSLISLGSWLVPAIAAPAPQGVPVRWEPNWSTASNVTGAWEDTTEGPVLKLTNTSDQPAVLTLMTWTNPPVELPFYGLDGRVRYDLPEGDSILELWSHFGDGDEAQAYFSRTMAESGLLRKLSGRSGWRDFRLPFNAQGAAAPPGRLVLNLHLVGAGAVWLTPGKLNHYANLHEMTSAPGVWWPASWAGWIGGGLGAFFGCFCALLGVLAQRGAARQFVLGSAVALIGIGALCLPVGIVAVLTGQPYHVYYPLLLLGVILVSVMLGTSRQMRANYRAAEERRMAALDTLGQQSG